MTEVINNKLIKSQCVLEVDSNIIDYKETDEIIVILTEHKLYGVNLNSKRDKFDIIFSIDINKPFQTIEYSSINKLVYCGIATDNSKYIYNLQGKYIGMVGKDFDGRW